MTLGKTQIAGEECVRSDSVCSTLGGDTIERVDRVPLGRQSWDITERFLPKPSAVEDYDAFDTWPDGDCRRIYRAAPMAETTAQRGAEPDKSHVRGAVAASKHSTGWAMRNTNNHNPLVLKKSCIGLLVCTNEGCGGGVRIRPAICDKARAKQIGKQCPTHGCDGKLVLHPCRGNRDFPVTHFWRTDGATIYFLAKGKHDHPRPSYSWTGRNAMKRKRNVDTEVPEQTFRKRNKTDATRRELSFNDELLVVQRKLIRSDPIKSDPDPVATWTHNANEIYERHRPVESGAMLASWPAAGGSEWFDYGRVSDNFRSTLQTSAVADMTPHCSASPTILHDCQRNFTYVETAIGNPPLCDRKRYSLESDARRHDNRSAELITPPSEYFHGMTQHMASVVDLQVMSYPSPPMPTGYTTIVFPGPPAETTAPMFHNDDRQNESFYCSVNDIAWLMSSDSRISAPTTARVAGSSYSCSPLGDVIADGLAILAREAGCEYKNDEACFGICT